MHIRTTFTFAAATLGLGALSTAIAGPTGGVVVNGQGSISTPSATTTVIDQGSQNLSLNWNTFNVAGNESVQFHQPSSSAVAFNRILDQNPSQIFGRIDANGRVVLVNPNGLLIGRTAQLNVNSLVASSLDAIDFDAASGRYRFSTNRLDPGAVINEGSITAGPGGSITLLGGLVSNTGSIVADYGTVNLAAGRAATLDLAGDGLLKLEVGSDLLSNGSGAVSAVENGGGIQANGGRVLLTANAVRDVFANLVNNTGVVRANRIENVGGTITLLGPEGTVLSSGTLDASSHEGSSSGGSVSMLGDRVGLGGSALVDVSGTNGGGTALIGGDYQGHNPDVLNASRTFVGPDVTINADAGVNGDGGRVIVWADDVTRFFGQINARGGFSSGNGGFAEVSGKRALVFAGNADMRAPNGAFGTLLLDPDAVNINNTASAPPSAMNDGLYDLTEDAASTVDINADDIASRLNSTDLQIIAHHDITQTKAIDATGSNKGSLTLTSTAGNITLVGITMDPNADPGHGAFTATATAGTVAVNGQISTGNRPVEIEGDTVTLGAGAGINTGSGTLGTIHLKGDGAANTLTVNGTLQTGGADVAIESAGAISTDAASIILSNGGAVTVHASGGSGIAGAVGLNGFVGSSGGTVSVTSDNSTLTMTGGGGTGIDAGAGNVTLTGWDDVTPTSVTAATGTISSNGNVGGNIVNGANTVVHVNDLTLSSTSGSIGSTGAGAIVIAGSGKVTSTAAHGVFISAQGGLLLQDTDAGDGAIEASAVGVLHVDNNKTVQTSGSTAPITLSATGPGATVTMNSGSLVTTNNHSGTISMTAANGIQVQDVKTLGDVTLSTTTGNIDALAGTPGTQRIQANTLSLSTLGGSIGASGNFDTSIATLTASALNDIHVTDQGSLTVGNISSGNTGTVISTDGTVTLGLIATPTTISGPVSIRSTNSNITTRSTATISGGSGDVTLRARSGVGTGQIGTTGKISITSDLANIGVDVGGTTLDGGEVALDASGGGSIGSGVAIATRTALLGGTAAHGVSVTDNVGGAGNLAQLNNISGGDGAVTLNVTGDTELLTNKSVTSSSAAAIQLNSSGFFKMDTGSSIASTGGGTGTIQVTGHDAVTMTSLSTGGNATVISQTGNIVDDSSNTTTLKANTLTLTASGGKIGDSATNADIDIDATTLSATAANGAFINEKDTLTLTGLDAGSGALSLTTGGALTVDTGAQVKTTGASQPLTLKATSGTLSMLSGSSVSANTGLITLQANGDVSLQNVTGLGDATITSTTGSISNANGTLIDAAGLLWLTAGNQIGDDAVATDDFDTKAGTLKATAAHGVYINESDAVTLDSINSGDNKFTLVAGGNITVGADVSATDANITISTTAGTVKMNDGTTIDAGTGSVGLSGPGNVTVSNVIGSGASIRSTGADIVDDTGANTSIQVGTLSLVAPVGKIGATGTGDIDVTGGGTLTATSANGAYINNSSGALTIANLHAGTGDIAVTSNGNLALAASAAVATTANVALTSTTGNISNGTGTLISGNALTLTASAGKIGDSVTGGELLTNVGTIKATATNGVYLNEANAVTLDDIQAGSGGFRILAGNTVTFGSNKTVTANGASIDTGGGILMNSGSAINAGAGDVNLHAQSNVQVANVTTTGAATLGSTTGSIATSGPTSRINAGDLSLNATSIGAAGAGNALNTQVSTLTAIANNGDIYVAEQDGLALTSVGAFGAGHDVNVSSATGDISVGAVFTPNTVTLAANTGAVTGGGGSAINAAGGIALSGGTAVGTGSITDLAAAAASAINVQTNGPLSATVASNTGQINLRIAGTPTLAAGAITLGSGTGRAGTVILQSGSDLNVAGLTPGAINIGANNTTSVGLVSGGVLTLPASGAGITDAPAGSLLVSGATDVVDNDASPRDLSFTADVLNFNSGSAGGATVLNTTVNRLDATVGSGQSLTVNETDGITLGTISAGGGVGNVTIAAGGAVTNDGNTSTRIVGQAVNLAGTALGAQGNELDTSAFTLGATASAGGIYVRETDDVALTAHATGGEVDVRNASGQLTVMAASGASGMTLASGAGNLTLGGAIDGGTGPVNLTAGGANSNVTIASTVTTTGDATITAGTGGSVVTGGASSHISARALTVSGKAIGNASQRLDTSVDSLTATAQGGGVYATDDDALTVTATATGPVDIATTNGALTVTSASGSGVQLVAGGDGNALTLNGAVNAAGDVLLAATGAASPINLNSTVTTGGNVMLAAGAVASRGAITTNGGLITGNALIANAASIGAGASPLKTAVTSMTAITSNGGLYVNDADALDLMAAATGGPLVVTTTDGALNAQTVSGSGVTLTAGGASGDLHVTGSVVGQSGGDVALTAGRAMTLDGAVGTSGNVSLTSNGSGSPMTLNGLVAGNQLSITAGPANGRGALVAGTGNQLQAHTATILASAIGGTAAPINTTFDTLDATTTNGGIYVNETNGIGLNASTTNGALVVTTADGPITVGSAAADGVTLSAAGNLSGITVTGNVQGRGGQVALQTNGTNSHIVVNSTVSATGAVNLLASGAGSNVTVNSGVSSGGLVTVLAGGSVVAGTGNTLTGNALNLTGDSIGGSGARVNTATPTLNATSRNGGIFVNQTGALALTGSATGGALDVQSDGAMTVASATGDGVSLATSAASADITVNGAVNAGSGPLTLAANGAGSAITLNNTLTTSGNATLTAGSAASRGAITATTAARITAASLTATGSSLGSAANRLNTTVGTLNATSTNGGTFVSETDALTLTASATGGALDVQTTNGALTVSSASGKGVTLTAGGAGSGITLNGAVDAGTSDVTLTAGTSASRGAIAAGSGNRVSGATLTATGSSIGSSASMLNTNIATLSANASSGDVYVREQDNLTLADVRAGGKVDIASSGGSLTVNSVNASGDVSLAASSGSIADDGDNSTRLTGKAVTLLARSIGAPSTLSGTTVDSKARLDIDATSLDATSTSGGIFIDSLNGLASTSLKASGGTDGKIELLTANGDINLASVSASDSLLLAAARNINGLPSLGTITARAAELRAGGGDSTAGHIGSLSQPLSLQLASGSTLRLFVPSTVDSKDSSRAPSTLPSAGVTSTLGLFSSPSALALQAGFGQFTGLGDTQFTSPAEALVRSIQSQTATTQSVVGLDWASFDPNVSLFGTLDPSVCLPGDQRDEEQGGGGC